ncbi:MAG: hypothetical protein IJS54_00410 [Desulfovibrio sp.]|nr:hypothetical protein [Desulfovibrio sp.]
MAFQSITGTGYLWEAKGLRVLLGDTVSNAMLTFGRKTPFRPLRPAPERRQIVREVRNEERKEVRPPSSLTLPPLPDMAVWPDTWKQLYSVVKPGLVVWTYPLLGCDLLKVDTTDRLIRREFFGRILQSHPLYPPGTHTFWPYCLPKNGTLELVPDLALFWAGVVALKARLVMVVGNDAGQVVLQSSTPFVQRHCRNGILATVVYDIAQMREDQGMFVRMLGTMRALLARIDILPMRGDR